MIDYGWFQGWLVFLAGVVMVGFLAVLFLLAVVICQIVALRRDLEDDAG